jgi:tetratricopeptide (TPR) repeat protein
MNGTHLTSTAQLPGALGIFLACVKGECGAMSDNTKNENNTEEWIPLVIAVTDDSTERFLEKLKRWRDDPSSEPELERWIRIGYPKGLPFMVRKPEQWELDHDQYFPMFKRARLLEKEGKADEALEIYMRVLRNYTPRGTLYYERPAIILERAGEYDDAILICDRAIMAISEGVFSGDTEPFERRRARLAKKRIRKGI